MINIQAAGSALKAWERLKSTYQFEDMVAVGSLRGTFFNLRLAEGEGVEGHIRGLDYALILSNSLPKSWDAFRQTLQPDLNSLWVVADRERIAQVIRSKVLAEGQRKEAGEKEEAALAARFEKRPKKADSPVVAPAVQKPKRVCSYCDRKGHLEADCWAKAKVDRKKKGVQPAAKANAAMAVLTEDMSDAEEVFYAH